MKNVPTQLGAKNIHLPGGEFLIVKSRSQKEAKLIVCTRRFVLLGFLGGDLHWSKTNT